MKIKILKTEEEYQMALNRLLELFDAPAGTLEGDEAEVFALLVEDYENRKYPIDPPDPIEAIKIRMEELELKQVDLIDDFGGKNRASEVLNRKRGLTLAMIRKLSKRLNLSVNVLTREYQMK
jgi:HTH-type transcriptional regulator / antitoxin HigA